MVLGVVIGVVHNRGVLEVVLVICMKWPPGEFLFEFAIFVNLVILANLANLVIFKTLPEAQRTQGIDSIS